MALREPHDGAHEYDPLKIPKLFTEITKGEVDEEAELDRVLEEMKELVDGSKGKRGDLAKQRTPAAAPMPIGEFRLERQAYK